MRVGGRESALPLQAQAADEDLGLELEDCEVLTDWVVKMVGAKGTVYEGEIYRVRVRFHADYPNKPPEVTFMRPAPVHEHIYSDGKICLNILYSDWEPKQDVRPAPPHLSLSLRATPSSSVRQVKSCCLSLLSMLSSAKKKTRPPDNDSTVVMSQACPLYHSSWCSSLDVSLAIASQGQKTRNMQWEFHDDNC